MQFFFLIKKSTSMHYVAAVNALQKENGLMNWFETFHDYALIGCVCAQALHE